MRSLIRILSLTLTLTLIAIIISGKSFAHDPNTATLDLNKTSATEFSLHIRTPLFHLDRALRDATPEGDTLTVGSTAYKKALASYIGNTLLLRATIVEASGETSTRAIEIGSTALKIGGHETNIILELKGIDEGVQALEVVAPLMKQNTSQINIIRYSNDGTKTKIFLDKNNKFSGTVSSFNEIAD